MTMDAYTHFYLPFIVPLFYGTEIISFGLTLFGFGDLVDKTLGGSDLTFIPYPHCQNSCHPHPNNLNGGKGDNHGTIQCRTQTSNIKQTAIA